MYLFFFFLLIPFSLSSVQVLKWKEQYGGTILNQLRRLGASLDWSREVKFLFSLVRKKYDLFLKNALSSIANFECHVHLNLCISVSQWMSKDQKL